MLELLDCQVVVWKVPALDEVGQPPEEVVMARCVNCEKPVIGRCTDCTATDVSELVLRCSADILTARRPRTLGEVLGLLDELCALDLRLPDIDVGDDSN